MRTRRVSGVLALALAAIPFGPAAAQPPAVPGPWLITPLDQAVSRHFEAPSSAYGPGHRGIDFRVAKGTLVRSAAAGIVKFAGLVAGRLAVTVAHAGGLETTYSMLSEIRVSRGDEVARGRFLGLSGDAHSGLEGLHFGVKLDGAYVDPALFLGPLDLSAAVHLAPLIESDLVESDSGLSGAERTGGGGRVSANAGTHLQACRRPRTLDRRPPPPNDNVAVAVAGIGSETVTSLPLLYTSAFGPQALGYDPDKVYYFSYAGNRGPRGHIPYDRTATYGSLERAGRGLRRLLARIGRAHPGSQVDLFAHSQGGLLARLSLEGLVSAWTPGLPRIDHMVTLATPHRGAPVASLPSALESSSPVGRFGARLVLDSLGRWSANGGPIPDPRAQAVRQLAPGSRVITRLGSHDRAFGTRFLSLAAAGDLAVPTSRSDLYGATHHVVSPGGLNAHGAILRSGSARAYAYAFLRDAAPGCRSSWERRGRFLGTAIDFIESHLGSLYRWLDEAAGGGAARAVSWAAGAVSAVQARIWRGARATAGWLWSAIAR
ncbi:MAG: peptidoglycan DD-metalloendopeptidase family protein [Actinomycetota bacterium]|nr:peptidoglycan DD-metalloendopeptidase family protein [Actinomycetota bacterium]